MVFDLENIGPDIFFFGYNQYLPRYGKNTCFGNGGTKFLNNKLCNHFKNSFSVIFDLEIIGIDTLFVWLQAIFVEI